ncbi:MAG: hypothetical protein GF347_01765 [Candidatus Moranbacteria bacterium]|nr:hypothetical protein [Candidatus Moranbacteria bacterium]
MQCKFIKQNNKQCNAQAMNNSDYCYLHNPDISDKEKKEIQRRGGQNRLTINTNPLPPVDIRIPEDVVLLLAETINKVRAGEMDTKTANCIGILSGHIIKAIEITDLTKRLEIIENNVNGKN